ncbi:potassium transporter [Alteromonadaceae bacterium M269]|nr:potassium transporter [Alteromonadaceae bacterium M269]
MQDNFLHILLLMMVAIFNVWLFRRINLPPILAYLSCGVLAGPALLGLYETPEEFHFIAELGVVFLLFSLGLEFSLPRMVAMRHLVFGVGLAQTMLTLGAFYFLSLALGLDKSVAFVIGCMAALSSTAIVIKQVTELGILHTSRSQMSVSILLFQDLAVVPMLIIIPLLSSDSTQSLSLAISMSLVKGIFVFVVLLSAGKWVLPKLFAEIARTRTDEMFVLTTILVILLAAGFTAWFGLSMALGAFLAGMMLGESQYKHQLEADIRPFRDILMGLFFITVGMRLNFESLLQQWYLALLGLVVLMIGKLLLIRLAAFIGGASGKDGWGAALKLCQMGEFSFVIAALATNEKILSSEQSSLLMSIGIVSMGITPWLIAHSKPIVQRFSRDSLPAPSLFEKAPSVEPEQAVILGFGRVGQSVSRLLKLEKIPYLVVDMDPARVQEARLAGEPVLFGDVRQRDILLGSGIQSAKLVMVTFDDHNKVMEVISMISRLAPKVPVVVRTRKDDHLEELYRAGASQVVPEILEGSLMLVSQVLHLCDVPMSRILKRVRTERKEHYGHMHGFFPGETTEVNYSQKDTQRFMHAIVLTEDAYVIDKQLEEIDFARMRVELKSVRRGEEEYTDPNSNLLLAVGDVLVIHGKPRRVERAEKLILEGL